MSLSTRLCLSFSIVHLEEDGQLFLVVQHQSVRLGWHKAQLASTNNNTVIFGEIIPQAICVRYGLSIGAFMAPFVLSLMWLLAPIAWPTAKLLDYLLGEDHGTVYKKSGLKTLVTLHKTLGTSPTDRLNQDEVTIISAVLDLKDKAVGDIMTPMDDVFTMSADEVLDEDTMNIILSAGYSRIPIHEPGNPMNFVGMLLVKILITYDPEDCKKVSEFALATLPETRPETSCLDIVNFFQEGKSHMVLVSEYPGENYGAQGVVTLEDVIEELIGEEIIDESDVYVDVHKAIRRIAPAPRARIAKALAQEEQLVDISDGQEADLLKKLSNGKDHRNGSPHVLGTSPKATFLKRSSSAQHSHPVPVRGNINEMREHLKHLGPSNVASRPKTTRYHTVKIKPPGQFGRNGSIAESVARSIRSSHSIIDEPYHDDPAIHGGEGEGLLANAGQQAKDGVQALQQGYGGVTYSTSPTKTRSRTRESESNGQTTSHRSIMKERSPAALSRTGSAQSTSTLASLASGSPRIKKRSTARSGSITENIVEAGGIRKVVLQTNSGSDIEEESENSNKGKSGDNSPTLANKSLTSLLGLNGSSDKKEEEGKKKRRRQRKKKSKGDKSGNEEGGEAS